MMMALAVGRLKPSLSLRCETTATSSSSSTLVSLLSCNYNNHSSNDWYQRQSLTITNIRSPLRPIIFCSSHSDSFTSSPDAEPEAEATVRTTTQSALNTTTAPPLIRRTTTRRRYRKQYPGESKGITEEMRFVAMGLRNTNGKKLGRTSTSSTNTSDGEEDEDGFDAISSSSLDKEDDGNGNGRGDSWQPSTEGFAKYLVDSKLVFDTIERIVDESSHVSYAYFRKTGLERSEGLSKDLEWFSQQDIVIPQASNPGTTYAKYLEELAEKSPSLFLCHFYNIYFSHIAGGQVIAKQVSEKLFEGRELEFYKWEGGTAELLRDVREKLNLIGEHWSRDEKNKCLREATKSFRFLGQIVRLIIL